MEFCLGKQTGVHLKHCVSHMWPFPHKQYFSNSLCLINPMYLWKLELGFSLPTVGNGRWRHNWRVSTTDGRPDVINPYTCHPFPSQHNQPSPPVIHTAAVAVQLVLLFKLNSVHKGLSFLSYTLLLYRIFIPPLVAFLFLYIKHIQITPNSVLQYNVVLW